MFRYQKHSNFCLFYIVWLNKYSYCCIITTLFIPYFTVFFVIFEYVKKNSQFQLNIMNKFKVASFLIICVILLQSCKGMKPGDAKKSPPDPRERVKRNLEEGKGFRLNDVVSKRGRGGDFEFASSNVLWRASLDIIDFMPLTSANYSGGIVITDWYSNDNNPNETIKITIRFLSNEIRSDALDIKVFYKTCTSDFKCVVSQKTGTIDTELRKEILKRATLYSDEDKAKNFKPYVTTPKIGKD